MTERFGKGQPRQGFCESFRKFPDGAVGALRNQDWVYALRLPVPRAHTAKGEAFLSTLIFLKQLFVLHSRRSQAPRFVFSEDCFCERRQKTCTGSRASKYQTSSPGLIIRVSVFGDETPLIRNCFEESARLHRKAFAENEMTYFITGFGQKLSCRPNESCGKDLEPALERSMPNS